MCEWLISIISFNPPNDPMSSFQRHGGSNRWRSLPESCEQSRSIRIKGILTFMDCLPLKPISLNNISVFLASALERNLWRKSLCFIPPPEQWVTRSNQPPEVAPLSIPGSPALGLPLIMSHQHCPWPHTLGSKSHSLPLQPPWEHGSCSLLLRTSLTPCIRTYAQHGRRWHSPLSRILIFPLNVFPWLVCLIHI